MMGGDFVIGVIVFAILMIVNFVVITKGSTRIAEVAARFTLDSMPGKQMAIDADLSSGLIDETEAKRRRKELEQESTFFGAMDGASKFVRGDAVADPDHHRHQHRRRHDHRHGAASSVLLHGGSSYTDHDHRRRPGQPGASLIISIAAGFLVSKSGVEGSADKALVMQLAMNPVALGMVSASAGVIAFVPGMPILPFAAISIAAGALAWRRGKDEGKPAAQEGRQPPRRPRGAHRHRPWPSTT